MAIFTVAVPGNDIKLGDATILNSAGVPVNMNRANIPNLGSGHNIGYWNNVLDGRYKIPPTGWSA